jgi:predicted lipoprotein with Yx(FWY)xxD motif
VSRKPSRAPLVAVAAAVVLTTALAAPSSAVVAPTVSTRHAGANGVVLVDAKGMTLYRNSQEHGSNIACTDGCTAMWLPLVKVGALTLAKGMTGKLATITRPDRKVQVTYNGIPLYRYVGDSKQEQATGQGVGGIWSVTKQGQKPTAAPSATPTTSPGGGTYTPPAGGGGTDYYGT